VPIYSELEALGWTSIRMTLAEQVAQLRELAPLSSGTRMLDVMIINVLDEIAQALGRLERSQPPGPDKV
jgi:signal transduction protein with GAF and PtsI domain